MLVLKLSKKKLKTRPKTHFPPSSLSWIKRNEITFFHPPYQILLNFGCSFKQSFPWMCYKNGLKIYVDIMTVVKLSLIWIANMDIFNWSVRSYSWGQCGGWRWSLFYPVTSFTLLEYMTIWCKIQVIINPFLYYYTENIQKTKLARLSTS